MLKYNKQQGGSVNIHKRCIRCYIPILPCVTFKRS